MSTRTNLSDSPSLLHGRPKRYRFPWLSAMLARRETYRRLPDQMDGADAFYDAGCATGSFHVPFKNSARGR